MHYNDTPPRLIPSVHEQPILRIRFQAPDGSAHQSTITSSWLQSVGFTEKRLFLTDTESRAFQNGIVLACKGLVASIGCTMLSVELIDRSTLELDEY